MKALCLILLLATIPAAAIEKPPYKVLEGDVKKKMELRDYADIPVASAPMGGMENQDGSFQKLFQYISGNNEGKKKIAMTSPVFMQTTAKDRGEAGTGKMSFMIPAEVAKAGAPAPGGASVSIGKIKGGKIAAFRFKGHKSEEKREAAVKALQEWIVEMKWTAVGKPFFAYYDPPWTPEMLRRNEVLIRVK